ncbi:hypothetical protein EHS25_004661 [Saitozyma podzolica]|uniref:Uncharacterized protein n=1 Tax=Saitozyma podzolica TaxID=1890683 RepID=A0A427YV24_9TREE|nr:hypothetical protein EHS25_004661 [Saitozyma podzolica]
MSSNAASSSKPLRPEWNKDEWAAKAKEKDEKYAEQAKANEAAMKQGKRPRYNDMDDMPKPTEHMKQRTEDVGINKNLNKTMLVQTSTTGKGPRGAGFYTLKDSLSYLDHLNGRYHLRKLGQTTIVARSTLAQVRAKIASLRAQTASKVTAKNFDFQARLAAVRSAEAEEKEKRREERKRKRAEKRTGESLGKLGVDKEATQGDVEQAKQEMDDMEAMMGFGGFAKKKR